MITRHAEKFRNSKTVGTNSPHSFALLLQNATLILTDS